MAKKVAKTRVFHIAKKIGVGSKDIVEKCESEGISDITGHMSAVSAGLEATIIEWFSEDGSTSSAVETAKKVNVTKAKARAKKKTKKKTISKAPQNSPSTEVDSSKGKDSETPIAPIGRTMDAPVKAKMSGPRVIRIEKPEPEPNQGNQGNNTANPQRVAQV